MRVALMAGFCLFLSGCASIDPVPYDPVAETQGPPGLFGHDTPNAMTPAYKSFKPVQEGAGEAGLPVWPGDLTDDALYMRYLGADYEIARNQVLVQKPFFDFMTVSFAAAAGANGIFAGSKIATTALGLTAAGSAATEIYFSPQTKIEAYNNGWAALDCGADVADQIDAINQSNSAGAGSLTISSPLAATVPALSAEIVKANDYVVEGLSLPNLDADDKTVLQTDEKALDAAVTAANVALLNAQNA